MQEAFLHWVWRNKRIPVPQGTTCQGEELEVIQFGQYNTNAGPDFKEGLVRIGGRLWSGHIEMHVCSSDWYAHGHHQDPSYAPVVLHVVYEHDREVFGPDGLPLPTFELKSKIDEWPYWRYEQLIAQEGFIPCAPFLKSVDPLVLATTWPRYLVERLERKRMLVDSVWSSSKQREEEAFLRLLLRALCLPYNGEAAMALTQQLDFDLLGRWKDNLIRLQAYLLGMAGLLHHLNDPMPYEKLILSEWQHLQSLLNLQPIASVHWVFHRMRPANFPDRRLTQFALLVHHMDGVGQWINESTYDQWKQLLQQPLPDYWQSHARWGVAGKAPAKMGADLFTRIWINAQVPVLIHLGKDLEEIVNQFHDVPPENNHIIRKYQQVGWKVTNLAQSQALLQLYKGHCSLKKCLNCSIGHRLIQE